MNTRIEQLRVRETIYGRICFEMTKTGTSFEQAAAKIGLSDEIVEHFKSDWIHRAMLDVQRIRKAIPSFSPS